VGGVFAEAMAKVPSTRPHVHKLICTFIKTVRVLVAVSNVAFETCRCRLTQYTYEKGRHVADFGEIASKTR